MLRKDKESVQNTTVSVSAHTLIFIFFKIPQIDNRICFDCSQFRFVFLNSNFSCSLFYPFHLFTNIFLTIAGNLLTLFEQKKKNDMLILGLFLLKMFLVKFVFCLMLGL